MALAADLTLDELRLRLAPQIAEAAIFDGWSEKAVEFAAGTAGVEPSVARLAFADGPMAMIGAFVASIDAKMDAEFSAETISIMPIRERIRTLVLFRLEAMAGLEEAIRRALAIEAMPHNIAKTLGFGWASADKMWRLAGDTATDYNHYTKRLILGGIYAATLAVWVDDASEDKRETREFLDRRIEGVMKFEKAKARLLREREGFSMTRFLGRLRYPAR
jgi:ubiquinone biosynthesis protein COQ9